MEHCVKDLYEKTYSSYTLIVPDGKFTCGGFYAL